MTIFGDAKHPEYLECRLTTHEVVDAGVDSRVEVAQPMRDQSEVRDVAHVVQCACVSENEATNHRVSRGGESQS